MRKVAVVTGAAKGLGRDISLYFAKEGYEVVAHYNKSKIEAESLLKKLKEHSPASSIIQADLKSEKEAEQMFKKIYQKYKFVDVLVNNVGNFLYKKLETTTTKEFKDVLESNVYCTLFCSRQVLPFMRKKRGGHIINIGAAGADRFILRENVIPYFMAKNGVYLLTKAMAREEGRYGIHINMVSPASMKTDIFKGKDFPMGREVKYADVVGAIGFLLSKRAYYINGANIEVSGGFIPGAGE